VEVDARQAEELIRAGEVQLVDVREDVEHEAGHIAGDRHVPMDRLPAQAETLDRDRPVLFYCRSGVRSLMAAQAFAGAGFQALSLAGGLLAWDGEGLPLVPDDGVVASH
jgi:rhodanese-related sulfurtransferase